MGNVCARDETENDQQDQLQNQPGMVQAKSQPKEPFVPDRREHSPQNVDAKVGIQASMLSQSGIASDWENTAGTHKPSAKVAQAMQSRNVRKVTDFPELKEYYAHPTATLRNLKNQSTYQGQVVRGIPEGWGTIYGSNGEVIEGLFKDGQPHSHLRYYFNDGSHYEGQFKNEKFEGEGTLYKPDGSKVYSKSWVSGKASGAQEEYDVRGRLVFRGAKDSLNNPTGNCYIASGSFTVEGDFRDGKPAGAMIKRYEDGREYRGQLNRDFVEEGNAEITFVDGRRYKGPFVKGVPHGQGILVTDSGKEVKQTWNNGRRIIA